MSFAIQLFEINSGQYLEIQPVEDFFDHLCVGYLLSVKSSLGLFALVL